MVPLKRIFTGSGCAAGFDYHHFELHGRGSYTVLHEHKRDHLSLADKPIGVYCISGGREFIEPIGFFDKRVIKAGVKHILFALEDGVTECECLFTKYDENGVISSPKDQAEPYEEICDYESLPKLVKEYLACVKS